MEIAVRDNETDKAVEYLDKIAADSPRRGNAELKAGQALWAAYLTASRAEEQERRPQGELDAMVAKAKATLEDGIKRMRVGVDNGAAPVSPTLAAATLSLGQILVDSGQPEKAIELMNDPKIGPLTLAAANDPAVAQAKFGIETYKLALRAYVATQALDKAEQSMNDLEKLAAAQGGADTAETLTRIYVGLGRELQEQVARLRQENKAEELAKVSKGFELFLERILNRESGNDFRSLSWVADTFYNLGSGYDADGAKELSPEAKGYYEKSLKADERILAEAKSKKDFLEDPKFASGVKLRMARSHRRLGQFNDSINLLTEILKEKSTLVEVQREAAETLQDWSAVKPNFYKLAILGAKKQKGANGREENLIWGWAMLAVKVQSNKQFVNEFHEARYNLAKCHMEQARLETDAAKKKELLKQAEKDILFTVRISPDMGGPEMRKKADTLLKSIQQLQGAKPTGLPAPKAIVAPKPAAPKVQPAVSAQPAGKTTAQPAVKTGVQPVVKPEVNAGPAEATANPSQK
jgi:tetratricopeptide (TPR) repeat protein